MMICQFFIPAKVCNDWRDIALTLRDKVFEEDEEHLIDIHDVKVTEEKCFNPFCVRVIFLAQLCPPVDSLIQYICKVFCNA